MKWAILISRGLLGLIYFVFGLNGFLNFIPMPAMEGNAGAMMGALFATGYFFPVLKGTEVIMGALLLSGSFIPMALIVLAHITLQIFLFHTILAPAGAPMAILMVALHGFLGWAYLASFKALLTPKSKARA